MSNLSNFDHCIFICLDIKNDHWGFINRQRQIKINLKFVFHLQAKKADGLLSVTEVDSLSNCSYAYCRQITLFNLFFLIFYKFLPVITKTFQFILFPTNLFQFFSIFPNPFNFVQFIFTS